MDLASSKIEKLPPGIFTSFSFMESCKITKCVLFILLFEDRIVYSYPPKGETTVVGDERRRGIIWHYALSLRGMIVLVFISCLLSKSYIYV